MIKFFLTGITLVFFALLFVQNSFAILIPPIKSTTSSNSSLRPDVDSEYNNKRTAAGVNTIKNQGQQTEKTSRNKTSSTNTVDEKHNEYLPEKNTENTNNKQQAFEKGKEFAQTPPNMTKKDILEDIKSPHGEVVIKKIKDEKSVTTLTTEDKRITGLQMPKGQAPAAGEPYVDNKNSKAETGIQFQGNKQQPVATENYNPNVTEESRY